jgi:acyl dehydratase
VIGRPKSELTVGETAQRTREISRQMIDAFGSLSGDNNPMHTDERFATRLAFDKPVAHGILTAGLISAVIGTQLPGPGTLYISQELRFQRPVFPGDMITALVEVAEIDPERNRVRLKTTCVNQDGVEVLAGEAWVKPPRERIVYEEESESGFPPIVKSQPWNLAAHMMQAWSRAAGDVLAAWRPDNAPTTTA